VKKTIALFFLATTLLSTTQLSELLKLPLLVQHYAVHKEQNQALSFLGFLELHYAQENPKAPDYDTDMKLPFKSGTSVSQSFQTFCSQLPDFGFIRKPYVLMPEKQEPAYRFTYTTSYVSAIWQPPQIS
jgi:hypothetical protein